MQKLTELEDAIVKQKVYLYECIIVPFLYSSGNVIWKLWSM